MQTNAEVSIICLLLNIDDIIAGFIAMGAFEKAPFANFHYAQQFLSQSEKHEKMIELDDDDEDDGYFAWSLDAFTPTRRCYDRLLLLLKFLLT